MAPIRTMVVGLALAFAGLSCGDDDAGGDDDMMDVDAAVEADAAGPDCYENPTTHIEIINACTDAEKIDKNPELPLLDHGTLPDLPVD